MHRVCDLYQKHCVPCEGGVPPLTKEQIVPLMNEIIGWNVVNGMVLEKEYKWKNFKEALTFVNTVGKIAEEQGHHPDIFLHGWNKVKLSLSTHAINGLSENDFILAAKIDQTLHHSL